MNLPVTATVVVVVLAAVACADDPPLDHQAPTPAPTPSAAISRTVLVPNVFTASTRSYTVGPSNARAIARVMLIKIPAVAATNI